jgi:NTP pyrophosphatase (non-canonical NTP hydrolase)
MNFLDLTDTIVRRTSSYGLAASQTSREEYYRWFLIWCSEISTELGELYDHPTHARRSREALTELGDVLWGITAVCQLLQITSLEFDLHDGQDIPDLHIDSISNSLQILNYAKKACRDGPDHRVIDSLYVKVHLHILILQLTYIYGINSIKDAIGFLDEKLKLRYPNGYTPQDSVQRVI